MHEEEQHSNTVPWTAHVVPLSPNDVKYYLVVEYGIDRDRASEIVDRRIAVYDHGVQLGSFTYFIGDEMVRMETMGLPDDTKYITDEQKREYEARFD